MIFDDLTSAQYLEYNAKLQQKKNELRKELNDRGILQRKGKNKYDNYKYFSEAQYKELFTELFSKHNLELNFSEVDYIPFDGTDKQANGRIVKLEFFLIDCETGFSESSIVSGEGIDKGDKAGYKAYTGAIKYYLADKFMVATGDDAEIGSPAMKDEIAKFATAAEEKSITELCKKNNIDHIELAKSVGWKDGHLTKEQHGLMLLKIKELQNGKA